MLRGSGQHFGREKTGALEQDCRQSWILTSGAYCWFGLYLSLGSSFLYCTLSPSPWTPGNQLFSAAVRWRSSAVRLRPTTLVKGMNGELKAGATETAKRRIGVEIDGRTYPKSH
jgi:hypothetical protein